MPENRDRRPEATRRGIHALAGFLLLAAALSACGGADAESTKAAAPAPAKATNGDSQVTANEKPSAKIITRGAGDPTPSLYAHLPGTLVVTDDNCIAVTTARSEKPIAVVWGHGWSVREESGKAAVYDADGKLFAREGDKVGLGGGSSDRFDGEPCATDTVFAANDAQAAP